MLHSLRSFFTDLSSGGKPVGRFADDNYRVAAAALLVHAATIDGKFSEDERVRLHAMLKEHFDLDDTAADELIAQASKAERESIDLYHFTRVLLPALDESGRCRIVEMLWEIAYADGKVTDFESNLIWRVADLLGISSAERIALRERVAAARHAGGA